MPNKAIAPLRRAKFGVRSSRTENLVHGWSLPYQEDEYSGQPGKMLNNYLSTLSILSTFVETNDLFDLLGKDVLPPSL